MPSLTEKPWFMAVCIPIAILGTSALVGTMVGTIMLSAASETVEKKTKDLASEILEIHRITSEIYQENLKTPDGQKIEKYFIDRGISPEYI